MTLDETIDTLIKLRDEVGGNTHVFVTFEDDCCVNATDFTINCDETVHNDRFLCIKMSGFPVLLNADSYNIIEGEKVITFNSN